MLKTILAVSAAGIAGTLLRFAAGTWVSANWPKHFYAATLAVNLVGCLIIGLLYGWSCCARKYRLKFAPA